MNFTFLIGIVWSIALIIWAAYPDSWKNKNPTKSIKNQLFTLWSVVMLIFSILWYLQWWDILFILLQILILISCVLMMIDIDDKIDSIIIWISWITLIWLSIFFSNSYNTIIFILWLIWLWLGYAFKMWSLRRDIALTLWSLSVVIFSYLEWNLIFLRLNIFFCLFSLYYTIKRFQKNKIK
jgi:hypothetical protein